ncbi:MAG: hypothetical protein SGJ16_03715 [Nitrospirota bacterium]|nr:hypothetical protein [Nitrospirota bacterium]
MLIVWLRERRRRILSSPNLSDKSQQVSDFRGKVALLDVETVRCKSCYGAMPPMEVCHVMPMVADAQQSDHGAK